MMFNDNEPHERIRAVAALYETPSGGLHMVNVTEINGNEVHYWDEQNKKEGFVDMSKMESFIGITK